MSSLSLFRRRDPWWEVDGSAARRARRKHRFVATLAFIASLAALGAAALGWAVQLGLTGMFGMHAALGIG